MTTVEWMQQWTLACMSGRRLGRRRAISVTTKDDWHREVVASIKTEYRCTGDRTAIIRAGRAARSARIRRLTECLTNKNSRLKITIKILKIKKMSRSSALIWRKLNISKWGLKATSRYIWEALISVRVRIMELPGSLCRSPPILLCPCPRARSTTFRRTWEVPRVIISKSYRDHASIQAWASTFLKRLKASRMIQTIF